MPTAHYLTRAGRARVVEQAREIVERAREMIGVDVDLVTGVYYREEASSCTGRRACAIGTLWLAAGVPPIDVGDGVWSLEGAGNTSGRDEFLAERPALALAYERLNDAARAYYDEHPAATTRATVLHAAERPPIGELLGLDWSSELEAVFEETNIDVDGMRAVFAAAASTLEREEAEARVAR